jgi:hypothetical protein
MRTAGIDLNRSVDAPTRGVAKSARQMTHSLEILKRHTIKQ